MLVGSLLPPPLSPVGLGLGYAVFGYGDTAGDLAVSGAVGGLGIGTAQWWLLRRLPQRRQMRAFCVVL
jgi:hypothetical protein